MTFQLEAAKEGIVSKLEDAGGIAGDGAKVLMQERLVVHRSSVLCHCACAYGIVEGVMFQWASASNINFHGTGPCLV